MTKFLCESFIRNARKFEALDPWGQAQKRIEIVSYHNPDEIKLAMEKELISTGRVPSYFEFQRSIVSEMMEYLIDRLKGSSSGHVRFTHSASFQPWMQETA